MPEELEVLMLLLKATHEGAFKWRKEGFDKYAVENADVSISICFLYPLLADDATSEPDIAKVSVDRLTLTFFNGTEGMSLVRQVLSEGIAEWDDHSKNVQQVTSEAITTIKRFLT